MSDHLTTTAAEAFSPACTCDHRRQGWRSRWAAVGAVITIIAGVGGVSWAGAANPQIVPSTVALSPCRIMDTRPSPDTVGTRATPLGSGETHTIQVTGVNGNCSIPRDAASVLVNVTVVSPKASGFVTVFPDQPIRPTASNLNYVAGQNPVPNLVNAALSSSGRLSFFASGGPVDLVADITGYTTASRLTASELGQNLWDQDPTKPVNFELGRASGAVAFDGTSLWVANSAENSVTKVDQTSPNSLQLVRINVGLKPSGIAFDGTSIWVTNSNSNTVSKISTRTNTVTATVTVGTNPTAVASAGNSIWVTNFDSNTVSRISTTTNTVTATVTVGTNPSALAFDGVSMWVANNGSKNVSRVSTSSNTILGTVTVGTNPGGVATDGSNVWVSNNGDGTVTKIIPTSQSVSATVTVGRGPSGMAFDGNSIWVANGIDGSVSKIDPNTNIASLGIAVGTSPFGVAFDGSSIWVSNNVSRLTRLRAS